MTVWRALTRNFGWKLAALVLSVILWFSIVGEPSLVTTHTVPILFKNLPPDLLLGSDTPDSVRVEVRGPSRRLTSANLSDLAMMLDLSSISGPGERTFTLADEDLHLPDGVTFLRAIPSQVRVRFARLEHKDVPVEIRIGEQPPAGYHVTHQEVSPDHLRIAGPERRVQDTPSAQTDALDLRGVTGTQEFRVSTFVVDPQVRLESSPMVNVKVVVEKN